MNGWGIRGYFQHREAGVNARQDAYDDCVAHGRI